MRKTIAETVVLAFLATLTMAGRIAAQDSGGFKDPEAYYKRAIDLLDKHQYETVIAESTKVIQLHPKYRTAYMIRGAAYAETKQYDKAIADFSETIRLNPKDPTGYRNRSLAYSNKGEQEKARADLTEAKRLEPK